MVMSFLTGVGPSQLFDNLKAQIGLTIAATSEAASEVTSETTSEVANASVDSRKSELKAVEISDEELCLPMAERDRKALFNATGIDVIRFLEQATADLHIAKTAEEQLKVMALRFDHRNWSTAWIKPQARGTRQSGSEILMQANLSHASMVLARYKRLLENAKRQEASALKAFHWQDEVRQEIHRHAVRLLVQSYRPHTCTKTDASYYGCTSGETIYRVKSLMAPRIACRFKEKREQYAVTYWIRVQDRQAKILEVDAKGHRLVKVTYDELDHRKSLSALAPNVNPNVSVNEVLQSAGLDPYRAGMIWRHLNRTIESASDIDRTPAGTADHSPGSHSGNQFSEQTTRRGPLNLQRVDSQ